MDFGIPYIMLPDWRLEFKRGKPAVCGSYQSGALLATVRSAGAGRRDLRVLHSNGTHVENIIATTRRAAKVGGGTNKSVANVGVIVGPSSGWAASSHSGSEDQHREMLIRHLAAWSPPV